MFELISDAVKMFKLKRAYDKAHDYKIREQPELSLKYAEQGLNLAAYDNPLFNKMGLEKEVLLADLIFFQADSLWRTTLGDEEELKGQAIENMEKALALITAAQFEGADISTVQYCTDIAWHYSNYQFGDVDKNFKRAIELSEIAIDKSLKFNMKQDYAKSSAQLCGYYIHPVINKTPENSKKALKAVANAEQVWTKEEFPLHWAQLQTAKAQAYGEAIVNKAENIEKGIQACESALTIIQRDTDIEDFSFCMGEYALLLSRRLKKGKRDNLELSVEYIEIALEYAQKLKFPKGIVAGLNAYKSLIYELRLSGIRSDNIKTALKAASLAKDFYKKFGVLDRLSYILNRIATLLIELNKVDRTYNSENFDAVISQSIAVAEESGNRKNFVRSLKILASYYSSNTPQQNIDKAVGYYEQAVKLSKTLDPETYYSSLSGLAHALINRNDNSFDANLSQALELFQEVHDYYEKIGDVESLIIEKTHIATTYIKSAVTIPFRIEKTIAILEEALSLSDIQYLREHGLIHSLLAKAYAEKQSGTAQGNEHEVLKQLIQSLNALDKSRDIHLWCEVLSDLAVQTIDVEALVLSDILRAANYNRVNLSKPNEQLTLPDNIRDVAKTVRSILEKTIDGLDEQKYLNEIWKTNQALGLLRFYDQSNTQIINFQYVLTPLIAASKAVENHPDRFLWADAQIMIATCYIVFSKVDESIDESDAIDPLNKALSIVTLENWPRRCLGIKLSLAGIYVRKTQFSEADTIYQEIIHHIDQHFKSDYSVPSSPDESLGLSLAPYTAIMLDDVHRAVTSAEKIRGGKLKKALTINGEIEKQKNSEINRSHYHKTQLLESLLDTKHGQEKLNDISNIEGIRRQYQDFRMRDIGSYIPSISTWVLLPFMGEHSSKMLLLPPNSKLDSAVISEPLAFGFRDFNQLFTVGNDAWLDISNFVGGEGGIDEEELIPIQDKIDQRIWDCFGQWLFDYLDSLNLGNGVIELTVIPQGALCFYPLTTLLTANKTTRFIDHFCISYAPSLYALSTLQERAATYDNTPSIAFIPASSNVEQPLEFVALEQAAVTSLFDIQNRQVLEPAQVNFKNTSNALRNTNYWHFATHGRFGSTDPSESFIDLDEKLYLDKLLTLNSQVPLRLVVLSACESGKHDTTANFNEPIGLASQFLQLGAIGTIATLWSVPDFFAALITSKFYEYHIREGIKPAMALRNSQLWFRDLSIQNLFNYLADKEKDGLISHEMTVSIYDEFDGFELTQQPFSPPCYWSAFVFYGC